MRDLLTITGPPKNVYNDSDDAELIEKAILRISEEIFGEPDPIETDKAKTLINAGFFKPTIEQNDFGARVIKFEIWNFLEARYQSLEDIDDYGLDIHTGMVEYFLAVN